MLAGPWPNQHLGGLGTDVVQNSGLSSGAPPLATHIPNPSCLRMPLGSITFDEQRFWDAARRGISVGATQFGRQEMPAVEDIQRQVAVDAVVAMKEVTFLLAVQRIVRGVQIQDDLLGRPIMCLLSARNVG